jgi:hypothetical protein
MNETKLKNLRDSFLSHNVLVRPGRRNSKVSDSGILAIHEAENCPFSYEENTTDEPVGEQDFVLGKNEAH